MPSEDTDRLDHKAERSVVVQLLGHTGPIPRNRLYKSLAHLPADRVATALTSLEAAHILQMEASGIVACPVLRRLDELGLLAI
jgi:hypothetical protein